MITLVSSLLGLGPTLMHRTVVLRKHNPQKVSFQTALSKSLLLNLKLCVLPNMVSMFIQIHFNHSSFSFSLPKGEAYWEPQVPIYASCNDNATSKWILPLCNLCALRVRKENDEMTQKILYSFPSINYKVSILSSGKLIWFLYKA